MNSSACIGTSLVSGPTITTRVFKVAEELGQGSRASIAEVIYPAPQAVNAKTQKTSKRGRMTYEVTKKYTL